MKYESAERIAETMSKEKIKSKLRQLGIDFHPALGEVKLSEKLFEAYSNPTPVGEQAPEEKLFDEVETEIKEKEESTPLPVLKTKEPIDAQRMENAAKRIREESLRVKGGARKTSKTYISKRFNHWVSTKSKNKEGVVIRYVRGQKSILPEEQKGTSFKVENLRFKGVEGHVFKFNGFEGLSIMNVSDPVLMEYIESLREYGNTIIHYDEGEVAKQGLVNDRMETRLKYWAYEAKRDDLIAVISYIEGRAGKKSFEKLMNTIDDNLLITFAIQYIKKDAEAFLKVMEGQTPKLYHLVHKANLYGIIKVSRDGRDVKMAENGAVICHSSLAGDWEHDLITYLVAPTGAELLSRLQRELDYYVV